MTRKPIKMAPLSFILSGVFIFGVAKASDVPSTSPQVERSSGREGALFRSRRIEKTKLVGTCSDLKAAFSKFTFFGTPYSPNGFEEEWKPWSKSDRAAMADCDSFPCDVKLDAAEVSKMKGVESTLRKKVFFELVSKRVENYLKTGARKKYEFPGDPVDPWVRIPEMESHSSKPVEITPFGEKTLFFRYHRFTDESYRPIRQIFDVRFSAEKKGSVHKIQWLVRDVYTAHYFDGWGEKVDVTCDEERKEVVLDQVMLVEFDLYKKTDLLSRISQKTMTTQLDELTNVYQLKEREALFKGLKLPDLAPPPRRHY